jgi:hypothetical protein
MGCNCRKRTTENRPSAVPASQGLPVSTFPYDPNRLYYLICLSCGMTRGVRINRLADVASKPCSRCLKHNYRVSERPLTYNELLIELRNARADAKHDNPRPA